MGPGLTLGASRSSDEGKQPDGTLRAVSDRALVVAVSSVVVAVAVLVVVAFARAARRAGRIGEGGEPGEVRRRGEVAWGVFAALLLLAGLVFVIWVASQGQW